MAIKYENKKQEKLTLFIKIKPESIIKTEASPRKQIKNFPDKSHI